MEDDNDILIEDDITRDIIFNGGVYVTTVVLDNAANIFGKRALKKNRFKIRTGAQKKHELF